MVYWWYTGGILVVYWWYTGGILMVYWWYTDYILYSSTTCFFPGSSLDLSDYNKKWKITVLFFFNQLHIPSFAVEAICQI